MALYRVEKGYKIIEKVRIKEKKKKSSTNNLNIILTFAHIIAIYR
jgi:hypothetical protein